MWFSYHARLRCQFLPFPRLPIEEERRLSIACALVPWKAKALTPAINEPKAMLQQSIRGICCPRLSA